MTVRELIEKLSAVKSQEARINITIGLNQIQDFNLESVSDEGDIVDLFCLEIEDPFCI
jgi:hypothetical protein